MLTFADYSIDTERRLLFHQGETIPLSPRALDLLEMVLVNHPAPVARNDMRHQLWPDTPVLDSSISMLLEELRSALNNARSGLQLVTTGEYVRMDQARREWRNDTASGGAHLMWGSIEIPLESASSVLGRDGEADIVIDAPTVSRQHARIYRSGEQTFVEDLDSKNGTFVGGVRLDGQPVAINDGDVVRLGDVELKYSLPDTR